MIRAPSIARRLLFALASLAAPAASEAAAARFVGEAGALPALPAHAKHSAAVAGTLTPGAVASPRIDVTLPDGRTVTAHRRHLARGDGHATWRGEIAGAPESRLTLTASRGSIAGTLVHAGTTYELTPADAGRHVLYAVEPARLPPMDRLRPASPRGPVHASTRALAEPATSGAAAGVVQDLLVVTTPRSRAALGPAVLEARIRTAVDEANAAYLAGGIGITLRLVAIHESGLVERANMEQTLDALRVNGDVASRRNATAADVVMLVAQHVDYCGLAYFMDVRHAGFESHAYGVTALACLSNRTLAHELGHVQGLAHDRETSGGGWSSSPYAFGFRDCQGGGQDIMAYQCTTGFAQPVNRFSSPRTWVNGRPLGVDYALEPARAADAARALDDSAAVVASFRTGPGTAATVPLPPAATTAVPASPTLIEVRWPRASTGVEGFVVERTTDGVDWTPVATLESGATVFADDTVAAGVVYSYRVRAFNGAGLSSPGAVATTDIDVTPEPIAFADATGAPRDRVVTSLPVTVRGINVPIPLAVSGGEHSVDCSGVFTATATTIANGDTVCVRHRSAAAPASTVTTTLVLGTTGTPMLTLTFSSTTTASVPGEVVATRGGDGGDERGGGGGAGASTLGALLLLPCLLALRRRSPSRRR